MPSAMYCLRGHFIGIVNLIFRPSIGQFRALMARAEDEWENEEGSEAPKQLPAFCTTCGASNISACQRCQTLIEVQKYPGGKPGYCGGCGAAFPWTETALSAAKEYTDELDQLSPEEKTTLKGTFADLASDTARMPLAASRFKMIMKKIGPNAEGVLRKIIETLATEAAKKAVGL